MINLEHLTEEERKIIMDVLQRDEQLRQAEQERVKKLKTELHELRRKSAVKVDGDSAADSGKKVCARCREPLGTIFNSGEVCPRCQHRVCSNCKVVLPSSKKWLCTVCNKQLQIRLESGDAFGPRREGQAEIYGSDLVKMSLAKSKPGLEPIVQVNGGPQSPADSGFHGRGANVPSVGENSTTFEDYPSEDYPSDVSYEQSMVSGVESIGPSVSERGSIVHPSGRGVATNHVHEDSTIVSNDVESGRYGSADITMERVPSQTGSPASSQRGRQGRGTDPIMQDPKCNASESGIESIHSGYTIKNGARGNLSLPVVSSVPPKDNQTSAVQSSNNKRFMSESTFILVTHSRMSSIDSGSGSDFDLSMQGISVDKVENRQLFTTDGYSQTNVGHQNEGSHFSAHSEEGQNSASPSRTHPLTHTSHLSNNNLPASLTSPHTGSPRPSRHVTNKMYMNTGGFNVYKKPTSNSDEFDTLGSERVYAGSGAYDFLRQSVSDIVDEKFSDTPGDESSRQSDTDTQSITSSSTVAWDTVADSKEMDTRNSTISSEADRQCITGGTNDNQSTVNHEQNSHLTKAILQRSGSAVASSGYESASSMSIASESCSKTNGVALSGPIDFSVRKLVVDEKTLSVIEESDYPGLQYFGSESSSDDFVILESDEELSKVRLSEKIPPDLYPQKDNNNVTMMLEDGSSHPEKEMALSDILYLQEQGSLLQNFGNENPAIKAKISTPFDSDNPEHDSVSKENVENQMQKRSLPGKSVGKVNDVQLMFHDLGSINSHYLTPQEEDDDDSSDCSSLDLSKLNFSDSSDSETFSDNDRKNTGKKVLMLGNKLATFENSTKEETSESVTEWGLSDDTDGLVPLVLPGMSSSDELSKKDKSAASGEENDSLVSSFLKRFIGAPRTPQQPSPTAPSHSDDEDDFKSLSRSLDISSDSDSVDDTHLEFDPTLIAESSEEKEAVYKSKLEYNKALMRSLIKDLTTSEEDPEQTSSGKEQPERTTAGSQSMVSQVSQTTFEGQTSTSQAGGLSEQIAQSNKLSKKTKGASTESSADSKPRRKKKGKSKSKLDDAEASVGYASKKGLMKQSKTQFGVLSSTADGKTQLYTFGGDKDGTVSPVDLSRGRYIPLKDSGVHQEEAKPSERPRTPYIRHSFPQPQIYRKQSSSTGGSTMPESQKTCGESSSSSSSSSCEEDDCDEDNKDTGQGDHSEIDGGHTEIDGSIAHSFIRSRTTRQFSMPVVNSSDSELSVIMEEPEEGDCDLEQSYDSKL